MKQITDLREVKAVELGVLLEIDKICREQNIRYFLCGGTLLGAIRHKGFIPWDDDIDIAMPRPDYDRFVAYCQEHDTPFGFCSPETDHEYTNLFAKAYDKNTVVVYRTVKIKQSDIGIWVDIFPVDGLGNLYSQAKKTMRTVAMRRYLLTASSWTEFFRNKRKPMYVECVRFLFYLCGKFVRQKNKLFLSIDRLCRKAEFEESTYCGIVSGYGEREILKREVFTKLMDIEFEGCVLQGLRDFDTYLSALYGDYMKLPPEEQRISHHDFNAYVKE